MGTSHLNHRQSKELGLAFSSPSDQALIDKFQNVGLHSHGGFDKGDHYADPSAITSPIFPLRPYAGDCTHYIKTGVCKFGPNCKFNHPVKRTGPSSQVVKDMDWGSEKKPTHAESKVEYYSTAGGFKFSKFRSYSHSKEDSDNAAPVLNFLGLPIRVGEKECPYYMRNGSCGYGAQCVFHHPEPSSAGEQDSYQSSLNDESLRQSGYYYGSLDRESAVPNLAEASKPHQTPWSSHSPSNSTFSYHKDNSCHSTARPTPLEMPPNSELNQYQAPEFPHQRSPHGNLTYGATRADMLQPINFGKVGEFPERPGQPECAYFIKTGYCKFKSACWFHHPKGQPACLLSENGLPLRPARSICRHYERFGTCKFGPACLFDHPINHNLSTVQDWSSSKPASGHDAGSWRK